MIELPGLGDCVGTALEETVGVSDWLFHEDLTLQQVPEHGRPIRAALWGHLLRLTGALRSVITFDQPAAPAPPYPSRDMDMETGAGGALLGPPGGAASLPANPERAQAALGAAGPFTPGSPRR